MTPISPNLSARNRGPRRSQQQGFAALLAVLLAGLSLTAITMGSMYSVRGVQDANLAIHKTTQSQARAWQGLEVVRIALQSMPAATLEGLTGNLVIEGLPGITAEVTSNSPLNGGRNLIVQVTAKGAGGAASTTVEGVYQVMPGVASGSGAVNIGDPLTTLQAVNIKGNLSSGGDLDFLTDGTNNSIATFNVDGDVVLAGSIGNFGQLCATGDIEIKSNITVTKVCTDKNLTLSGGASVGTAIVKGNITVSGGASIKNITTSGTVTLGNGDVDSITSTGDINHSGNGTIGTITTDGNVILSSSASANLIKAKGNVSITGGNNYAKQIISEGNVNWTSSNGTATSIHANGTVRFAGQNSSVVINAQKDVTITGSALAVQVNTNGNTTIEGSASAKFINSAGNVDWNSSGTNVDIIHANGNISFPNNKSTAVIKAGGNVTLTNQGNVKDVFANGNFSINTGYGIGVQNTLRANGSFNYTAGYVKDGIVGGSIVGPIPVASIWWAPLFSDKNIKSQSGLNAGVEPVATVAAASLPNVPPIVNTFLPTPKVDAYALESSANYVFKIDSEGNKKVTVRGVKNIDDGTYFLADYKTKNNNLKDYLCTAINNQGECTAPATPNKTLCASDDGTVSCFSYAANKTTWSVERGPIAPGVAWFEGSLSVAAQGRGSGVYFNTFIATENIETTGGTATSYAVNYADYKGVCLNQVSKTRESKPALDGIYPKAFCEKDGVLAGALQPQTIGNSVFIAGGYKDGVFQGGDINLGSGNIVYGSIIAGNTIQSTGNQTVHGHIFTAAQGTKTDNKTVGSLTIDLRNLPDTYQPEIAPCMGDCTATTGGENGASPSAASARIFWSRYL